MHKNNLFLRYVDQHFLYLWTIPLIFFVKGLIAYPFTISFADLSSCMAAIAITCLLLYKVAQYFLKDQYKAAYFTILILVLCFSSVDIYFTLFPSFLRIRYYLVIVVLLPGLCFIWLKAKPISIGVNRLLNSFSVFFLLLFLINNQGLIRQVIHRQLMAHKPERDLRPVNSSFPDIYILLLDGYANNNNLKKYWHFSNDPFLDSLRKDGFFVLGSSLSNYPYTVQTVSTMLNMDYHQTSYALTDNPFLLEIANNKTVDLLSDKGYQIHNFSLFDFNTHPSPYHLAVFSEKSLMAHFINQTVFYFVSFNQSQENVLSTVTLDRERKLVSKVVELTKQASDQPKFVYGHFFLTHPPFYLNSQGKVDKKIQEVGHFTKEEMKGLLNDDPGDDRLGDERRERVLMQSYLNHIQEANRYMNLLVHSILTNSKRPPIILMMSDHGYRFLTGVSPQEKALERYGNLCAFYFPDHHYQMLSDSITPVNYMRLILSKALGEPYPLLPNKSNLVVDRNPFMVTHQE